MIDDRIKELARMIADTDTTELVEALKEAFKELSEQPEDKYLYFGDEGQPEDPRLPAGVLVEGRDDGFGWDMVIFIGYDAKGVLYPYKVEGDKFEFLRVKKSEIIDIGERAVGRLVEAWDDGAPEDVFRGYCINHRNSYGVVTTQINTKFDHVRLINNAEREEK